MRYVRTAARRFSEERLLADGLAKAVSHRRLVPSSGDCATTTTQGRHEKKAIANPKLSIVFLTITASLLPPGTTSYFGILHISNFDFENAELVFEVHKLRDTIAAFGPQFRNPQS
jgi:hypothetical protein